MAAVEGATGARGEHLRSYRQKINNHVIPRIGGIPLQQLSPVDLNRLYRELLDGGRAPRTSRLAATPTRSTTGSPSCASTATPTKPPPRCSAASSPSTPSRSPGTSSRRSAGEPRRSSRTDANRSLSPRTVRYVHSILHAALKDALRWNRSSATPPTPPLPRRSRRRRRQARHLDRRPAPRLPRLHRGLPLPARVAVHRHQRLPARRVPRPPLGRRRPRGATATLSRQVTVVDGTCASRTCRRPSAAT